MPVGRPAAVERHWDPNQTRSTPRCVSDTINETLRDRSRTRTRVRGSELQFNAQLRHHRIAQARVGIGVDHILHVRLHRQPGRDLREIAQLDRGLSRIHRQPDLLLSRNVLRPIACHVCGDAELVGRPARQHAEGRQAGADIGAEAIDARVGDTELDKPGNAPFRIIRCLVECTIEQQIGASFAMMPHRGGSGIGDAELIEARRVVPHADRGFALVGWWAGTPADAIPRREPLVAGSGPCQQCGFGDQQQPVTVVEGTGRSVLLVQRCAIQRRDTNQGVRARLVCETDAERGIRKDGRPGDAALPKLGADAKRAVEKQGGRAELIELGVQVIATDEDREAIVRKVVLEPRLINPQSWRSADVAAPCASPANALGWPPWIHRASSHPDHPGRPARRSPSNASRTCRVPE